MMILAVDIGNTQTCVGAFENVSNELKNLWRFSTPEKITVDEATSHFMQIIEQSEFSVEDVSAVCISCVVPSLTVFYTKAINAFIQKRNLDVKFVVCNAKNSEMLGKNLYNCKYVHPNEVGGDIIAACVAARVLYDMPCAIIDFGTATNINVINSKGEFVGAIISPGLKTSLNALVADAGALSDIEIKVPSKLLGNSTPELIQSGSIIGEAARADGFIDRIEEDLGEKVHVICTGGWSKLLHSEMKHDVIWNPSLILQGLKIFVENFDA